jgi:hypothetical protein
MTALLMLKINFKINLLCGELRISVTLKKYFIDWNKHPLPCLGDFCKLLKVKQFFALFKDIDTDPKLDPKAY